MKHKLGLPMKHDPLSFSLIWWFVGIRLWILEFGLLVIGGFLILDCWCGGGDFAMDFGWVARLVVKFDFAMNFGF